MEPQDEGIPGEAPIADEAVVRVRSAFEDQNRVIDRGHGHVGAVHRLIGSSIEPGFTAVAGRPGPIIDVEDHGGRPDRFWSAGAGDSGMAWRADARPGAHHARAASFVIAEPAGIQVVVDPSMGATDGVVMEGAFELPGESEPDPFCYHVEPRASEEGPKRPRHLVRKRSRVGIVFPQVAGESSGGELARQLPPYLPLLSYWTYQDLIRLELGSEASYLLGEVIRAVRTRGDLDAVRREFPAIGQAAWLLPWVATDVLKSADPEVVLDIFRILLHSRQFDVTPIFLAHPGGTDPIETLIELGMTLLERGRAEGAPLIGAVTRHERPRGRSLGSVESGLWRIVPRQPIPVPRRLMMRLVDLAHAFAAHRRYASAVRLSVLIAALGDPSDLNLPRLAPQAVGRTDPDPMLSRIAGLGRGLLARGWPAEAPELWLTGNAPLDSESEYWGALWRDILGRLHRLHRGWLLRIWDSIAPRATAESTVLSESPPGPPEPAIRLRDVMSMILRPDSLAGRMPPLAGMPLGFGGPGPGGRSPAFPLPEGHVGPDGIREYERRVIIWLEGAGDSVVPPDKARLSGQLARIGINIGDDPGDSLGGAPFREPDWGDRTELDLIFSLSCIGADVASTCQSAVLPRRGTMQPVYFEVMPEVTGMLTFHLSILLAHESLLLQKIRFYDARIDATLRVTSVADHIAYFKAHPGLSFRQRMRKHELRDALATPDFSDQIIYFFCHGERGGAPGGPANSLEPAIALSDGERIKASDLEDWLDRREILRGAFPHRSDPRRHPSGVAEDAGLAWRNVESDTAGPLGSVRA
jgi:hypothetical protein